jgi:hypothetical protein
VIFPPCAAPRCRSSDCSSRSVSPCFCFRWSALSLETADRARSFRLFSVSPPASAPSDSLLRSRRATARPRFSFNRDALLRFSAPLAPRFLSVLVPVDLSQRAGSQVPSPLPRLGSCHVRSRKSCRLSRISSFPSRCMQSSAFVPLVLLAECCGSAQPPVALGFGPLAEAPELVFS